ncbi:MAG: hypothetical protein PHN76_13500 [Advenella sp.]|uniref:deoxynucleotide monophosphate kinase family protein n=1 Tax=Advenella sp. TaxID=1872388 RepID=UPI00258810FE|nr:hypothetical protein [Advenella sp.]MDD3759156.1 hypothetical protein [Advenella sp.]
MKKNDKFIVIGLAGRARAGKNTVAEILQSIDSGFCQCAFADALRVEVIDAFRVSSDLFNNDDLKERKDLALAIVRCDDVEFIDRMTALGHNLIAPRTPREIMQLWGTEYRRNQDSYYWIDRLSAFIHEQIKSGARKFVVTDVRFEDEAQFIKQMNGSVWLIQRNQSDSKPAGHKSEHIQDISCIDKIITNNRDLFSLTCQVIGIYGEAVNEEAF